MTARTGPIFEPNPRQVQGAIPVPGLSHQWLVIRWLNPLKPAVFFHLTNGKPVSSFLLSLVVETPCRWESGSEGASPHLPFSLLSFVKKGVQCL